jgi:hypothetical protein
MSRQRAARIDPRASSRISELSTYRRIPSLHDPHPDDPQLIDLDALDAGDENIARVRCLLMPPILIARASAA